MHNNNNINNNNLVNSNSSKRNAFQGENIKRWKDFHSKCKTIIQDNEDRVIFCQKICLCKRSNCVTLTKIATHIFFNCNLFTRRFSQNAIISLFKTAVSIKFRMLLLIHYYISYFIFSLWTNNIFVKGSIILINAL